VSEVKSNISDLKKKDVDFLKGDTVITGREVDLNFIPKPFLIPKGTRGFIVSNCVRLTGSPRIYFGFKDINLDLWASNEWRPISCKKVLTEKTKPKLNINC